MRRILVLLAVVALMVVMLAMAASAAIAADATYTCTATSPGSITVGFGFTKDGVQQFKADFQAPDTKVRCVKE